MVLLPTPRHLRIDKTQTSPHTHPQYKTDPALPHPQAYTLTITPTKIEITSATPAGQFYAHQTLNQLKRQYPHALPCIEIQDHPDFPTRGVMLDISRDKVPTMPTLFALIDLLAEWKINQLQLYTEHTFAYSEHRTVWENASPTTAEEIRQLDRYCRERFIDLVPNQNSFGHLEPWLRHPSYAPLAEAINGAQTPWGFFRPGPFSLCPIDPKSIELLRGLYTELLPNFTSPLFNVGCDETYDIGQGRSKAEADRIGVHRVYLNFLNRVSELVTANGKQMMFWGDVILHQPDLIAELPKNVIALQWGYEADHPFDAECEKFQSAGVPFYVCPGTSTWNSIAGRTDNAIANLRSAAKSGLAHGAIGYLITDWGDNGHLQYQPTSYPAFAAGAAFSWCLQSNQNLDLPAALNLHAFQHPQANLGQIAIDLGNVYQACGKPNTNGSSLFRLLVPPPSDAHPEKGMTEAGIKAAERAIEAAQSALAQVQTPNPELKLITDEFQNAAEMLHLCIHLGRHRLGLPQTRSISLEKIKAEHQRLWLARNRIGGLSDSIKRLDPRMHTNAHE
jgi:hypothetical protein